MNSLKPSFDTREFNKRLVLTFLLFLTLTGLFVFNGYLEWDEGSFLMNAEVFAGEGENFENSRPAALSLLVSFIWQFTGESVPAARFMVMMFGAGSLMLFYRLADHEFEKPLIPTAVLALSPLMIYWSSRVYTDVPALFFLLGSLLAYRKDRLALSGIMVSLAATFRYIFLLFALGILAAALIDKRESIIEYCAGGLAGSVPFFSYSWMRYRGLFSRIRMYITRVSRWSDSGMFSATLPSLAAAGEMLSGLLPPAIVGWKKSPNVEKTALLAYSIFMIVFSGNTFTRYWLAVLPVVILMAYRGSDMKLFAAASAVMILFSGVSTVDAYQRHQSCMEPLNEALQYSSTLDGEIVSDNWAIAGYKIDGKVYSTWTSYEELNNDYGVEYAVVSENLDYPVLRSFPGDCRTYYVYDISSG